LQGERVPFWKKAPSPPAPPHPSKTFNKEGKGGIDEISMGKLLGMLKCQCENVNVKISIFAQSEIP
jgi:hypothetical protein